MKFIEFSALLFSWTLLFQLVNSEKILVLEFFSSRSHKITYMRLIEELANRGHEITIVSGVKPKREIKNVTEILTFDVETAFMRKHNVFDMKEAQESLNPFLMLDEFTDICRKSYELPQVKAILKENYDLIFVQPLFNDCALGMVYKLKAPLVLFFSTSVPSFLLSKIGGDLPPSITPFGGDLPPSVSVALNVFLGSSDEMTFAQRFVNFGIYTFMEAVLRFYYEPHMTSIYREKIGSDIPSVGEILGNASLVLSNGHFILSKPKSLLPNVVEVGGIHSRAANPLPKDLEEFVTKSEEDGFILFSLGSIIKEEQMSESKRKIFLNVFSKLKQQVLWKWESESMPNLPKNVRLSKWLPQQDLLGHRNIKTFITHCGGGSTEEAIYHGVPLIAIPMYGDQIMNAAQASEHGFVITIEWKDLTEEKLTKEINEILNKPIYRNNVRKLSKLFKDQQSDPLERGVYWVEYILRHKGAPHLRSAGRKLNYFQYHSWDVIAAYLIILLLVIYMGASILKLLLKKAWDFGNTNVSLWKKIN